MVDSLTKTRRARLDLAVEKLLDFQGSSGITLANTSGATPPPPERSKVKKTPPSIIGREFLRQGEVVETVGRLVDKCKENLADDIALYEELGLIVVPSSSSSSSVKNNKVVDSKVFVNNADQGVDQAADGDKKYTVLADMTPSNSSKAVVDEGLPELHVIQVMNPESTPSTLNTDICSIAMNQLPTVEMTKAIPYLNIEFLAKESGKDFAKRGKTRGITLSRHLLGSNLESSKDYEGFVTADFLPVNSDNEDPDEKVIAGMELFTSPQTMIPQDSFNTVDKSFKDPFRPFMSIDSFNLTANSPKYGMDPNAADVSATIEVILHDRSRLQDIQELVTPGGFSAGGRMRVTYGFSHPESSIIRSSDAQKERGLYGDIINGLRVSELFNVYSSEFTMTEDGEVKVTISAMSNASETGFAALNITDAWDGSVTFSEVARKFNEIKYLITELSARENLKKITVPSILSSKGDLGGTNVDRKTLNAINKFIAKIVNQTADTDAGELSSNLKTVADELFGKEGDLAKASSARATILQSILDFLKRSPDPFGVPSPPNMPSVTNIAPKRGFTEAQIASTSTKTTKKHVTLGKALTSLIGIPMQKAYAGKGVSEIQMIFYGFNESAGAVQDFNIASFPIIYDDLEKLLNSEFEKNSTISLGQLVSLFNSNFLKKENSPAYGVANLPKNITQQQAINRVYGTPDDFPHSQFRLPEIGMSLRMFTATADGLTPDKSVIRIEIYDNRCGNISTSRRLLEAASRDGFFYKFKRYTRPSPPGKHSAGMNHQKLVEESEKNIDTFLTKLTEADLAPAFKEAADSEKLKNLLESIKETVKKVSLTKSSAVSLLKETFPSLVYGSESTGIISADVSSYKDEGAVEIQIARENNALSKLNKGKAPSSEIVSQVYPVQCKLNTYGCPFFNFSQQFFIDFGTGTSIDNIYGVNSVSHTITAGEFKTNLTLIQEDTFPILITPEGSIGDMLVSSLLRLK